MVYYLPVCVLVCGHMIIDGMNTSKAQLTFYWPCGTTTITDSVSWELPAASQVRVQREDSYFFCNVARTLLRVPLLVQLAWELNWELFI